MKFLVEIHPSQVERARIALKQAGVQLLTHKDLRAMPGRNRIGTVTAPEHAPLIIKAINDNLAYEDTSQRLEVPPAFLTVTQLHQLLLFGQKEIRWDNGVQEKALYRRLHRTCVETLAEDYVELFSLLTLPD